MKQSDRSRGQALWVWWKIFFALFAGAGLVISVFNPIMSFGELLMGTAAVMLLALAADLLCYFVIFKALFRKSRRRLDEYSEIIAREGVGKAAHEFARREYERSKSAKKGISTGVSDDREYWSIELAQAMLAEEDAKGAAELLQQTDMSLYLKNSGYEAFQPTVFKYYSLLISADMSLGDRAAADSDYSRALPFLESLSKDSLLYPRAMILKGNYLMFSERFAEAEDILEKLSSSDRDIVLSKYILSGQLYMTMGNTSRAESEFDKALGICPPEQVRAQINKMKEKLSADDRQI